MKNNIKIQLTRRINGYDHPYYITKLINVITLQLSTGPIRIGQVITEEEANEMLVLGEVTVLDAKD